MIEVRKGQLWQCERWGKGEKIELTVTLAGPDSTKGERIGLLRAGFVNYKKLG